MNGSTRAELDPLLRTSPLPPMFRLRIAVEIVATYAEIRWRLLRGDIRGVVEILRRGGVDLHELPDARRIGLRLGQPVRRTLDPLPFDSRCFMRSLVLLRMLARRGVLCQLVIGVRPGRSFEAHAWIEHEGLPLLPTLDYEALTVL